MNNIKFLVIIDRKKQFEKGKNFRFLYFRIFSNQLHKLIKFGIKILLYIVTVTLNFHAF